MAVNQPRQQGSAAQIDNRDASRRIRLYFRWSTNFLDLSVFNQDRNGRSHVARPGVDQMASFY